MNDGSHISPDPFLIPASDPGRAYIADQADIDKAVSTVLHRGRYILGPACTHFENAFSSYLNIAGTVGTSSGTDAIELSLRALGIGTGDEVILPALTSSATATAAVRAGATPVIADIRRGTFGLDPDSAASVISPRTRAILPVHLYGHPCDLGRLEALCQKRGLLLVEDCAQAHGAKWGGRSVGTFGAAGAFSFYPTKNLAALGDSGALVSGDPGCLARARTIRQYGWLERQVSSEIGMNSRMDELQAAVLSVRLPKLDARNARRREIADRYNQALAGTSLVLPGWHPNAQSVYHQYVVQSASRDALKLCLLELGIQAQVLYPTPLHLQGAFAGCPRADDLSCSAQVARELLCLPIHPELTDSEVQSVVDAILTFHSVA